MVQRRVRGVRPNTPVTRRVFFMLLADTANNIQGFNAQGFQVGTAANVNTAGNVYWYFGFATGTNFSLGTYTGTGAPQTIATSFTPDHAWVKRTTATQGVTRDTTMTGSTSVPFINTGVLQSGGIEGFTGGIQVGTGAETGASGGTYQYAIWQDTTTQGTPTYALQTGYYVGDGGAKIISGLGFTPDVVILKANTNAGTGAIMKTTAMPQNNVSYLGVATADNTAGAITFTRTGFGLREPLKYR